MINNGFMYWIFFTLSKMIYSVIPGLYDAFEFFGTYEFFDLDTDIRIIWGNLYVLLSVLVLFAIAIKLINAIVNPDLLDDKKNGVKKVFIKAFVAVFLTVLTPYMFTLLVDVQENIFKNKTIDKIFFNTTSNQNTGKVIAWTAITSFIDLNALEHNTDYDLDTSALNGVAGRTYVLSEEVDKGLDDIYASQPWQHTDTVPQHPILMLAAGVFIVYEFILLVLDTALRSIKLGVLQMMTPIILGAYIFKEDILKKWALEYIKTFVQVFLLLVSISLMTKILSLLPNITEKVGNDYSNNWMLAGIINVLAIMAMLRLVHQIIPLINKIFGTNIEGKGGIRGRLGEMAAVGGLAQRAWDSFRQNPARALTAPVSAVGGWASHMAAVGARANRIAERQGGTRGALMGAGALAAGFLTSGGAIVRGARQGWTNGNLQSIGGQYSRYNETHLPNSTFGGRILDNATSALGLGTRIDREQDAAKKITYEGTDMTVDQLQARITQQQNLAQLKTRVIDAVNHTIEANDSQIKLSFANSSGQTITGTYQEIINRLNNDNDTSVTAADINAIESAKLEKTKEIVTDYASTGGSVYGNDMKAGDNESLLNSFKVIHAVVNNDNPFEYDYHRADGTHHTGAITNIDSYDALNNLEINALNQSNAMQSDLDIHNQKNAAHQNTMGHLEPEDSHTSVNNGHGNGGNNGGNNH